MKINKDKVDQQKNQQRLIDADIALKLQHLELLKAQTRRENAQAARLEKA